jgi:hypothetical protein
MPLHDAMLIPPTLQSYKSQIYRVTDTYVSDMSTNLQPWLYTCRSIKREAHLLLELPGSIGVRTYRLMEMAR